MKITRLVALLLILFVALPAAVGKSSGQHRTSTSKTTKDSRAKTVHVRSYTTKKGKHVKAYNRRPPKD